jgi:hypothetical protein
MAKNNQEKGPFFFNSLEEIVTHLRNSQKKCTLLYSYNGTGKTRLSMAFKDAGKKDSQGDTLYFNAFTEDLFSWDNDLIGDTQRILKINAYSRFFAGLENMEMESRIRRFLDRYADFDFRIDYSNWTVSFSRDIVDPSISTNKQNNNDIDSTPQVVTIDNIKVSRGEENIFIWCFFLAIVQLVIDGEESYKWVKYIYIDDPISSLDEHNAIAVANHLAQLLKNEELSTKVIISSHHTLFFNVLCNEFKANQYFLTRNKKNHTYILRETTDTPFFHHVATLAELKKAAETGELYTHHFNMLRSILEKTASFHGFKNFSACIKQDNNDEEGRLYTRVVNIMSHGNYSLYEPKEMLEENKILFTKVLNEFMQRYPFNQQIFTSFQEEFETS